VLVTSVTASDGVRFVERLITNATGLPALRAGLHFGNVVERDGDVFGAAVNLAARVAAEAHPGEVLGTEPIATAASECGIAVIELGKVALKNVSQPVTLHSLALVLGASDTPIDPVCQVPIDRRNAVGHLRHQDAEYWFCSLTCAAAFASNPNWHIAPRRKSA
jgi:adenylate cyclase